VLELPLRIVQTDAACSARGQRNREARRTAPQLEDVLAGQVAQEPELGLRNLPRSPGSSAEELTVLPLVLVRPRVPRGAIGLYVLRRASHISSAGHFRAQSADGTE